MLTEPDRPTSVPGAPDVFADGAARNVVRGLLDFRFRTMTAIGAARGMYVLVCAATIVLYVWVAVLAFGQSVGRGLVWSVAVGPASVICMVVLVRVFIEFLLAILILMIRLEETTNAVLRIVDNTTDISAQTLGLPTMPGLARGLRTLVIGEARDRRKATQQAHQGRQAAKQSAEQAADLAVQAAVDAAVQDILAQAAERAVARVLQDRVAPEPDGQPTQRGLATESD